MSNREPNPADSPPPPRARGRKLLAYAASIIIVSALLMLMPLVIPLGDLAKYPVGFGFVGLCLGLAVAINGAIDVLVRKP